MRLVRKGRMFIGVEAHDEVTDFVHSDQQILVSEGLLHLPQTMSYRCHSVYLDPRDVQGHIGPVQEKGNISFQIVQACQRLWQRNMLAAADGNVSYRVSDDEIWITPSGVAKGFMHPEEMAVINLKGKILKGKPSSERVMHLEVYRSSPHARSVVHAHPPFAIAWSVAEPLLQELPSDVLSEVILACDAIPFVPYATPGTSEMAEQLRPFLPQRRLMILSRHGALSWGETLDEAVNGMERLEHSAQILWNSKVLGGLTSLSPDAVLRLKEIRSKMGPQTL